MTLIRRPAPIADVVSLRQAMDWLFDDRFMRPIWTANAERAIVPALDVYTTTEAVVARMALPGVKPEDVDISIVDDFVTIKGSFTEEKETSEAGYVQKELSTGLFERSFTTPAPIKPEGGEALFKDGLLTLTLLKSEAAKPQHVKVIAG